MYYMPLPNSFTPGPAPSNFLPTSACWTSTSYVPPHTTYVSLTAESPTTISSAAYSWAHTVPTFMPWVAKSDVDISKDSVMRFTAPSFPPDPCTSQTATSWELLHNLGAHRRNLNQHLKRRSEGAEDEIRPYKQYISEERMTARFKELQIDPTFEPINSYDRNTFKEEIKEDRTSKTLEELEAMIADGLSDDSDSEDNKDKGSLVLAPELKKLVIRDSLLSKGLMNNHVERPSMALVLWKPPGGLIREKINEKLNCTTSEQEASQVPFYMNTDHYPEPNNNSVLTTGSTTRTPTSSKVDTILPFLCASDLADVDDDMDL